MCVFCFFFFLFRVPVPVSGSGQFKLRRQGSELLLDGALSPPCQRMGAMVAFQCFDDFKRSFFKFDELSQSEINQMLMSFFWFCRNFDEVLSSFAEPLMENTPFSESCSSFYDEEHFKVSGCDCIRRTGLNNN